MLTVRQYKYFYSAIALFFIFTQALFAQNKSGITDSLLQTLPQYHTKGLLKIHWLLNGAANNPWYIPNGAIYEGTWGKKTTYDMGFTFTTLSHLTGYYEIAGFAAVNYYIRKAKNNYTFKGFFVRSGLGYSYIRNESWPYTSHAYGILVGFGYQTPIWHKWHCEISTATLVGRYDYYSPEWGIERNKWDAFRWNELAFRLGYRLF